MSANPILSEMQTICMRNALKFHVAHDIFCKTCGNIMDVRRAVSFDIRKGDKLIGTFVRCAECFDAADVRLSDTAQKTGCTIEVSDGRFLFNKAEPGPHPLADKIAGKKVRIAPEQRIGKRYEIRHSSGFVTVKVLGVKAVFDYGRRHLRYRCLNEKTGRDIIVKSAAKFRREVQ